MQLAQSFFSDWLTCFRLGSNQRKKVYFIITVLTTPVWWERVLSSWEMSGLIWISLRVTFSWGLPFSTTTVIEYLIVDVVSTLSNLSTEKTKWMEIRTWGILEVVPLLTSWFLYCESFSRRWHRLSLIPNYHERNPSGPTYAVHDVWKQINSRGSRPMSRSWAKSIHWHVQVTKRPVSRNHMTRSGISEFEAMRYNIALPVRSCLALCAFLRIGFAARQRTNSFGSLHNNVTLWKK